ncbi:MAG: hypothetical protein J1F02_09690 [Lachnospiraceae bacterium]|nr:hypothetical protein [Lachnospiraceae bacterium]
MSDYMRKIIYLKKIERGMDAGVNGFARLEKREGKLMLYLALPGQGTPPRLPVYVVYEKGEELYPLLLGTTGEEETWQLQVPLERMGNSMVAEQIRGIILGKQDWYLTGTCPEHSGEIVHEQVKFAREEKKPVILPEVEQPPKENAGQTAREEEKQPSESVAEQPSENVTEQPSESNVEPPQEEAAAASLAAMPAGEPERVKDPFLAGLEEMYPFEDDEMEWCLQIEPSDFSSFPMEFWHYAKNSFLLQGFYNYRHLLYAHSKNKNYVGVPGQFHRREQYLASRFGFPRFKATQKKRITSGDFGYWLKEL